MRRSSLAAFGAVGLALLICLLARDPRAWLATLASLTRVLAGAALFAGAIARATRRPRAQALLEAALLALIGWLALELVRGSGRSLALVAGLAGGAALAMSSRLRDWLAVRVGTFEARHRWLFWFGLAEIVALPTLLAPLIADWNISGFYDSRTYDVDAWRIATGERPMGNSFVMPGYQYGMALFYWAFGHRFAVQQIVSVLLALMTIALVALTARNLCGSGRAAFLAGLAAAVTGDLRRFLTITQVENWYVPSVALTLFAFSCQWRTPSRQHAAFVGLAAGIALNIRSQGSFFFLLVCLSPLCLPTLAWRERLRQLALAGSVAALTLLPWSVRNLLVEGRFSPVSDQATIALLFNHPRTGFYGLRNDLAPWWDILKEYEERIPSKTERYRYIQREFWENLRKDPARHARAFFWRSLAFYGLLPPGIRHPDGPRPTDWSVELRPFLLAHFTSIAYLAASAAGLLRRPSRLTLLLAAFIVANLAVLFFAAQAESRISYPVLPIHLLLALAAAYPPAPSGEGFALWERLRALQRRYDLHVWAAAGVLFFVAAHLLWGRAERRAPLRETAVVYDRDLKLTPELRSLRDVAVPSIGDRLRLRGRLSNYQLPPKNDGDRPGFPWFASHPRRETYYFFYPQAGGVVAVSFFGAMLSQPLVEDDFVDIEAVLLEAPAAGRPSYAPPEWLRAERVIRLGPER